MVSLRTSSLPRRERLMKGRREELKAGKKGKHRGTENTEEKREGAAGRKEDGGLSVGIL